MNCRIDYARIVPPTRLVRALRRVLIAVTSVALLSLGPALVTFGQEAVALTETEPNNTCATAQDLGALTATAALAGALDSTPDAPDVDFFRFKAKPQSLVVIDLDGTATGRGTLNDPLLGALNRDCQFLAVDDDGGVDANSRLRLTVPWDGALVVGVTACCDGGFNGGGIGSYTLTAGPAPTLRSISGRIVNARTGAPVPSTGATQVSVALQICENGPCSMLIASTSTDAQGRFRFERDYGGNPLLVSTYNVVVNANSYMTLQGEPFDTAADQAVDLGDLQLMPQPVAGSISGRVVDLVTGAPLRGNTRPFARVELRACEPDGCYYGTVASANTDAQGRFRFTRDMSGNPLLARDYQVVVSANQYDELAGDRFSAAEGQQVDLGDLRLRSHPLRFTEIRPCGNLPLEGGDCAYSVRVTNGLSTTLEAGIWSLVSMADETGSMRPLFQAGNPVALSLAPGANQVLQFQFHVPESAPDNHTICAEALGGRTPDPQFNVLGRADLFCITKGTTGFALLSDAEANAAQHPQTDELVTTE